MKLLLLHGPAINSSRKKLSEIKSNFNENDVVIFEKGTDIDQILANLQTVSMFDENRLVIIENSPDNLDSGLWTLDSSVTLALWFDHEIKNPPSSAQVFFFPEEKEASIFPLLDSLGNRDEKAFLELAKRNKTSPDDTQYILTMVFYLLRNLVVTPKAAKDFVKAKNERMRKNFTHDELINLYKSIIEIDYKIKSGFLETKQAEFLLVNNFLRA